MPTATFNIGRDGQIVFLGPFGQIDLNYTSFKSEQMTHEVVSRPLGGFTQVADIPDLWNFTVEIDRNSPNIESAVSDIEAAFYLGANLQQSNLYLYVSEIDGSVSTWQYGLVSFKLSNAGDYKKDDAVKQTVTGRAGWRKRIS